MKNLILCFILVFSSQLINAQKNGPYEELFDNGKIKVSGQYDNGKPSGPWKEFYENGQLHKLYGFTDGKRNKETKSYFENGALNYEVKRIDGVFIGNGFYESGELFFERLLNNGYYTEYYKVGTVKVKANYSDRELSGLWTSFYETGEKEWEVNYYNGYKKGIYQQYYKSGQIKVEGKHKKNKKSGTEKRYSENGELEWEGAYLEDALHKKWKKFDARGKTLESLIYKNGMLTNSTSETNVIPTTVPNGVLERVPVFPGCEDVLGFKLQRQCMSDKVKTFVNKNFNTDLAGGLGLTGLQRIIVAFKIDTSGKIIQVRAKAPHPRLAQEAERVARSLPKMKPGEQRGKAVTVPYSLPINFMVKK